MQRLLPLALALAAAPALFAQANVVAGLDGRLSDVNDLTYWGRRGAAHPGGEVGMSMLNTMCNPGSVNIPWYAAMQGNHGSAETFFGQAILKQPDSPVSWLARGMSRADQLFGVGALGVAFETSRKREGTLEITAGDLHAAAAFLQRAVPDCL